ncbi:MAG: hypothetical protein Fur0021_37340 [Candidatus Promineifilaceae bacterium]
MEVKPVQIMEQGVLIPLEYLHNAREFEFELVNGHVLVWAKQEEPTLLPGESSRFSFVGIALSRNPNASIEVEEILQREPGLDADRESA